MKRFFFMVLVALFSLIWSSAFIAAAVALEFFDPFSLLVVRLTLSALILLPFGLRDYHALFNRKVMRRGLLLGVLNNAVYLSLSFCALQLIRPEIVIVIVSCAPFVTTLASVRLGLEPLSGRTLAGIALGFLGVLLISGVASSQFPNMLGVALAVVGMLAFATGTVLFRRQSTELPILQTNFWQSLSGAVALLPLALLFGQPLHRPSFQAILAVLYLVFVVTIAGMALWMFLIRSSGAAIASSYHLLNPFFGVVLAHLVLGKELRLTDFLGAVLIGMGLILTTSKWKITSWRKSEGTPKS